jgi:hypothetical protein
MSMSPSDEEAARKYAGGPPYEFTPVQNEVIGNLGSAMKWVALPAFALAAMTLFYLIMFGVWAVRTGAYRDWQVIAFLLFMLASLILYFAMARWIMTASVGFRAIVETRGRDMPFLMLSLDNLRKMFEVLAFFVKVFLIVSLIGLVMSVVQAYRTGEWPQYKVPEIAPASKEKT